MIRQQVVNSPVVQKVAPAPGTVVVSGGQVFATAAQGQQIVVGGNQVVSSPGQVSRQYFLFLIFCGTYLFCACCLGCYCNRTNIKYHASCCE